MNVICQKCGGLGIADVSAGDSVECAHCQHVAPAVAAPVKRKPVRGGGLVRLFGLLVLFGGIAVGLDSIFMETAPGNTHNIGLISDRENRGIAGLAMIVLGIGLHIIGQLDLANAHLARLNEREP